MITIRLKVPLPAAIDRNQFTSAETRAAWSGKVLEPYGKVIPAYDGPPSPNMGYPYNVPHVAVGLPGYSCCTVVALDEIDGDLPTNLPPRPTNMGIPGIVYNLDNALGY